VMNVGSNLGQLLKPKMYITISLLRVTWNQILHSLKVTVNPEMFTFINVRVLPL
jgi:hypothetical protein